MKHLKSYKYLFESRDYVKDILLELEDIGLKIKIDRAEDLLEVCILRPFISDELDEEESVVYHNLYGGKLFFWHEIKDDIIRLNDWYYKYSGINDKTFRMFKDTALGPAIQNLAMVDQKGYKGIEFGIGWHKPEDFNISDHTAFNRLIIEIKL